MICHGKTGWHQVIAIKNRRNIQLADFLSVLKCLIHTYSAIISIFLVLIMNFPHSVSKRLILPWFTLTPKIIVKLLSADLQRIAVKTDFSDVSAVICPDCYIHQSLFFPDFWRLAAKKAAASSKNSFISLRRLFSFSNAFIRFLSFLHFFCFHFTSLRLVCQVLLYYIRLSQLQSASAHCCKPCDSAEH